VLPFHPTQKLQTVVQIRSANAEDVVAELLGFRAEELGLTEFGFLPVAEEIPGIERDDVIGCFMDSFEKGGPPGQPA
jgi:hypothetical protein